MTPVSRWRRDALQMRQDSEGNSIAQNANSWLALSERRLRIPLQDPKTDQQRPDWSELVRSLPSPRSWPEILRLSRARYTSSPTQQNAANWYFAARLQNDRDGQVESLRALHGFLAPRFEAVLSKYPSGAVSSRPPQDYRAEEKRRQEMAQLTEFGQLLFDSPSLAQQAVGLKWQLETLARGESYQEFSVPDLVTRWGEKAAAPQLKNILLSPARLSWYGAGKTADLARKMWLSDPKFQNKPQWSLANSAENWKFSLAMVEKFPRRSEEKPYIGASNDARASALTGLLETGQFVLATQTLEAWLRQAPNGEAAPFPYGNAKGARPFQLRQLQWIEATLKKHPQLAWWGGYGGLSLRLGQTPHRLQLLKNLVGQGSFKALPNQRRHTLLSALATAYLDADDAKNGGDTLVCVLQTSLASKSNGSELNEDLTALLRLTRIVPNASWLQAARKGAQTLFVPHPSQGDDEREAVQRTRIALRFAEQKQAVFAQSLLAGALEADRKAKAEPEKQSYYETNSRASRAYLFGLMEIYHQANRPADMVHLLENADGWGERELTPLLTFNGSDGWDYEVDNPETKALPRLGYLAAWALAHVDRRAPAVQITRALIEREGGYDPAYQLLCDLQGEAARPFLQKLAASDRFEERPLLWQAVLSRQSGKLSQAQALAQQAIAIDPSDGEEGPDNRLRAYAELGAAFRAQHKIAEAQKVETAVRSIRLAEKADYLRIAGLTSRAIALYERSLRYFDNAYCVQSRLAVQLTGIGRYAEASSHFRRAYELMPTSFGRLESHCFGCEGVFGGKEQNSIAREVFLQLEKARPNDPKIAYLSGYWRKTSDRGQQAAQYFERAVKLDPLYLSAWKQLSSSDEYLTPEQRDRATLALIQLDPRGIHDGSYGVSFEMKRDYRGLWNTTQSILSRKRALSKANFFLRNSKKDESYQDYSSWELVTKPADAIAGQSFVRQISQLAS